MTRWTDDHIARVKHLAEVEHLTSSKIALRITAEIGRKTSRSSICGLADRYDISLPGDSSGGGRAAANRMRNSRRKAKEPRFESAGPKSQTPVSKAPQPLPIEGKRPSNLYALVHRDPKLELPANGCRWFYGDPLDDPVGFCGVPQVPGLSWCSHHAEVAIEAPVVVVRRDVDRPAATPAPATAAAQPAPSTPVDAAPAPMPPLAAVMEAVE